MPFGSQHSGVRSVIADNKSMMQLILYLRFVDGYLFNSR